MADATFISPPDSWSKFFSLPQSITHLNHISDSLKADLILYEDLVPIFPPPHIIFRALQLCPPDSVKVCIIGQDCYHGIDKKLGIPQANGLCFSVDSGCDIPPSLRNILKEINDDLGSSRSNPDLSDWAEQGVLLINSALTVKKSKPESYLELWKPLTDSLIEWLSSNYPNIVFILWGNYAKNKKRFIIGEHTIIEGSHPSPLSANRGGFFGGKYFSKTNIALEKYGKTPITWV